MTLQSEVDSILKNAVDNKEVPMAGAVIVNKEGKVCLYIYIPN